MSQKHRREWGMEEWAAVVFLVQVCTPVLLIGIVLGVACMRLVR